MTNPATQSEPAHHWNVFAERCYRAGEQVIQSAEILRSGIPADDPKTVGTLILIRTLSNFKGAVALAELRLVIEARILARCCFENLFTVVMLQAKGKKFLKQMDADREADRRMRGEFLLKVGGDDERLRRYLQQLPKSKGRLLNPKTVAAGPLECGYAYYAQLSADSGHPGLDALDRYVSKQGEKLQVSLEPSVDDSELCDTVHLACQAMIGVAVHVNTMLDGPDTPELDSLIREVTTTFRFKGGQPNEGSQN